MCKASHKLILCSCSTEQVHELKNFWEYYQFIEGKYAYCCGSIEQIYTLISREDDKHNRKTLAVRVNEPDLFDTPVNPKSKDRLLISLHNNTYCFEFKRNKWNIMNEDYNYFEWTGRHDTALSGKIKNALIRNATIKSAIRKDE
jgi:hypothetical protein